MTRGRLRRFGSGLITTIKVIYYPALLTMALAMLVAWHFQAIHHDDDTKWGVSYSHKYADELGIDWQDGFTSMLDDVGFRRFRLMSYWDEHQPEPYRYDFTRLDWLMDEAAKRDAKVSLAIGARQPRWPECHIPDWAKKLNPNYESELLKYLRLVVQRYREHPALESYQLENEYANRLFGECREYDRLRLGRELATVQRFDKVHPVIISASNQVGIPIRYPIGDRVGFSIYDHAYNDLFERQWSYWYVPATWHSLRAGLVELLNPGRRAFIHELQTEPWGQGSTRNLSLERQNELINAEDLKRITDYGERTGMSEIYLWGAEWWYWRSTHFNDPSLLDTVKNIIQ